MNDPNDWKQLLGSILDGFGCQTGTIHQTAPDGATLESIANKFSAIFPTRDIDRDIQLSQILAYLDAPSTASKLVTALKSRDLITALKICGKTPSTLLCLRRPIWAQIKKIYKRT